MKKKKKEWFLSHQRRIYFVIVSVHSFENMTSVWYANCHNYYFVIVTRLFSTLLTKTNDKKRDRLRIQNLKKKRERKRERKERKIWKFEFANE